MAKIRIPDDVRDVMRVLLNAGYKAYVVGGAVRDILLGLEPEDWDVATNARPEEVIRLFKSAGWTVVPKGIEFGVVSVIHPITGEEIEIATFRREMYLRPGDRRSLRVEYADTLEEDVRRRDFTINALAADIEGNVIDLVGGLEDLRKGVIRFIGDPDKRILEDPLRMLRAIRFAAKFGFRIDPETFEAIRRNVELLKHVSRERIGEEIWKAAKTSRFALFARLLWETGLYRIVMPEMEEMAKVRHDYRGGHRGETVLKHTFEVLERLDRVGAPPELKLAALLHDIGKPETVKVHPDGTVTFHGHEVVGAEKAYEIVLHRWRLPGKIAALVKDIVRYHMVPLSMPRTEPHVMASKLVARYGRLAKYLALHAYADTGDEYYLKVYREVERILSMPKPLLTGRDIMRLYGVEPGPEVGRLKQKLYEIQVMHGITSKEELIRLACEKYGICPVREVMSGMTGQD